MTLVPCEQVPKVGHTGREYRRAERSMEPYTPLGSLHVHRILAMKYSAETGAHGREKNVCFQSLWPTEFLEVIFFPQEMITNKLKVVKRETPMSS